MDELDPRHCDFRFALGPPPWSCIFWSACCTGCRVGRELPCRAAYSASISNWLRRRLPKRSRVAWFERRAAMPRGLGAPCQSRFQGLLFAKDIRAPRLSRGGSGCLGCTITACSWGCMRESCSDAEGLCNFKRRPAVLYFFFFCFLLFDHS